ncbi:MAG: isoprenylcysteine carboxylmethyltransferase family protein [Deltaproteobacteria bacterium]|nr:isoprenylcysteine carboxylmethyltransferase family protein [Deltaproteobacteria bacterium]
MSDIAGNSGTESIESAERLKRIKRRRIVLTPVRWLFGMLIFSLPALGPQNLYTKLPGMVFGALFFLQLLLERSLQAPNVGGQKKDRASYFWGWLGYYATFAVSVIDWKWFPVGWKPWAWNMYWIWAGIGLFILGQGLRVIAIVTLGRFFTAHVRVHKDHKVIQHGIYAYLRHPSYTGMLLVALSYVTLFASAYGYIAFFLFDLPGLLNRIRIEEKVLRKDLGRDYRDYCSRVKRLIPFVY